MFAKRLQELRGKRTQDEIAEAIGVSRATYSHYETGRSEPAIATLVKIAELFDVSLDDLLGKDVAGESRAEEDLHLLLKWKRANDSTKKIVLLLLNEMNQIEESK